MMQKHRAERDFFISDPGLYKLCDVLDLSSLTLNMSNLWLCTRLPMVRSVAIGRLRSSFTMVQVEGRIFSAMTSEASG